MGGIFPRWIYSDLRLNVIPTIPALRGAGRGLKQKQSTKEANKLIYKAPSPPDEFHSSRERARGVQAFEVPSKDSPLPRDDRASSDFVNIKLAQLMSARTIDDYLLNQGVILSITSRLPSSLTFQTS